MKYQLVLQWNIPFPIHDIDDIVAIEDQITDELAEADEVDGHEFGSGEAAYSGDREQSSHAMVNGAWSR